MSDELSVLKQENEELRKLVLEMDQALRQQPPQTPASKPGSETEFEQILEEKSEVIRGLHSENLELKKIIADMEERLYGGGASEAPLENAQGISGATAQAGQDILELQEQRDKLKREITEMEKHLCEEEVRASRERADLARQRYEIDRVKTDLEIELDKHQKDKDLRSKIIEMKSHLSGTYPAMEPPAHKESSPESSGDGQQTAKPAGFFQKLFGMK